MSKLGAKESKEKYPDRGKFIVLSCPWVYDVVRTKDLNKVLPEFLMMCERRELPAFRSQYVFTKANLADKKVDRESAIIDGIYHDIDGLQGHASGADDVHAELLKFYEKAADFGFKIFTDFSGNSGYRVFIPFATPKVKHRYQTVRALYERFSEVFDVQLDTQAQMGTQQKIRIQNSVHQKSGLYSVPLTEFQAKNLSLEQIKELAKKAQTTERDINGASQQNTALTVICEKLDKKFHGAKKIDPKKLNDIDLKTVDGLRPCTSYIIEEKYHSFYAQSVVGFEMVAKGFSDKEIHQWAASLHGKDDHEYDYEITQYQIDMIRSKIESGELSVHGCNSIKKQGFCVRPEANNLSECNTITTKQKKEKILEEAKRKVLDNARNDSSRSSDNGANDD